jgi:hypothetical protein
VAKLILENNREMGLFVLAGFRVDEAYTVAMTYSFYKNLYYSAEGNQLPAVFYSRNSKRK